MNTIEINRSEEVEIEAVSPRQLLIIALVFEGFLFLVYLVASYFMGTLEKPRLPYLNEVLFGSLFAALLFVFNGVLVRLSFIRGWVWMTSFIEEMIVPLVSRLGVGTAFMVSLAAGIGEEFFFRGLLQPHIGIIPASILFSIAHFLFEIPRYWPLVLLYFFIGILFGLIYELFNSLWAPVIFHTLYDFMAILYFRYAFPKIEALHQGNKMRKILLFPK
jgi:membrane protease YdiL (CAAX protease family)